MEWDLGESNALQGSVIIQLLTGLKKLHRRYQMKIMRYQRQRSWMSYLRSLSFRTNFCRFKKNKVWLWTVVNSHQAGVLKWVIGDRSQETFRNLWWIVRGWCCFLYITDGWKVYPCFIDDCDQESPILSQLDCGANIVRCQ